MLLAALAVSAPRCSHRPPPLPPPAPPAVPAETEAQPSPGPIDPSASPPRLELRLEPSVVEPGESALLSWESVHADLVSIDHEIGPVLTSGRIKLFPDKTTTYTLTAEGRGGIVRRRVVVSVSSGGREGIEGDLETLSPQQRFQTFMKPIYFDLDSAALSERARLTLEGNVRWLLRPENRQIGVVIEGHCDRRGSEEYNLALGDRRAQSVKQFMNQHGIASARMWTISWGEERPFTREETERGYALNRRVQFKWVPDK